LQWSQNPSQISGNNLKIVNVKPVEFSGTEEVISEKNHKLETNSKNKNIRDYI
jgi:hypothetical protein